MAPFRPTAGVLTADRRHLVSVLLPTLVLLVLLFDGIPTAGAGHVASPVAARSAGGPGAQLLLQAQATPGPASSPSPAQPAPAAGSTPRWTDLQTKITNQVPAYRYIGSMDYDPIDHYVVLFGGFGNGSSAPYSDTWTYANGRWTELDISGPPGRYAAMMTWDAADGYMLLFGGIDESTSPVTVYNDTWTFVHGAWTQLSPNPSPSERWRGAMAYDASDNYTVLFGGTPTDLTNSPMSDTWTYKAGVWTNVTKKVTGSPAARYRQDMTYDAADGYLVMFGGCTTSDVVSTQDTLTYHNYTWTLLSPSTKPPGRTYTGIAYDPADGYVVMFGGVNEATNTGLDDTWEFLNGTWTDLTTGLTTAPSTRGLEMMTYDATDGYLLLFGGQNPSTTTYFNDTWAFGPSIIGHVAVTPSTVDVGQSISVNATPLAFTGTANFTYSNLPPGCTNSDVEVLSCTPTSPGIYNISVVINDSNGIPTTKNTSLTVNPDLVVTSFAASPTTLTVGSKFWANVTDANGTTPYTYAYSGLPTGCITANTPSLSCTPSAAGNATITVTVRDSVGWSGSRSVSVTVNPKPALMALVASPATIDLGGHFTLWANATGGTAPLTWTYLGLPVGCTTVDGPTMTCTPTATGTFALAANVTDSFGFTASAAASVTVNAAPAITAFVVSPASIDIGQSVTFWLNSTGGTGVLTASYSALPPGCSLGHLDHASCSPTVNGTFVISGLVTDTLGVVASQTVTLSIAPAPNVDAVTVTPNRVDAGQMVNISVAVSGGTAPYTFAYSGLPTGCVNTTTAVVTCQPRVAGTFNFIVQASDAWKSTSQLGAVLTVDADPSIGQFTASVSPVTVGSTTYLQTTVNGGSGVYTFVYSHLPAGCTSANKSSLPCTPSVTGSFNVTVTVTDSFGRSATAQTEFVVQSASAPSGFLGFSGSTGYLLIGLVILVVLIAVVALVMLMRRRGGDAPPEAPAEEWQEPPPEGEAP
jgi:hypothetical protein